mmetsp:Transcript_9228/g.22938  ORF Transcript_9228/g.22938 Transcript_9228/m.22938 type:complete len:260 (-) Transcript_9228:1274-2053(-)
MTRARGSAPTSARCTPGWACSYSLSTGCRARARWSSCRTLGCSRRAATGGARCAATTSSSEASPSSAACSPSSLACSLPQASCPPATKLRYHSSGGRWPWPAPCASRSPSCCSQHSSRRACPPSARPWRSSYCPRHSSRTGSGQPARGRRRWRPSRWRSWPSTRRSATAGWRSTAGSTTSPPSSRSTRAAARCCSSTKVPWPTRDSTRVTSQACSHLRCRPPRSRVISPSTWSGVTLTRAHSRRRHLRRSRFRRRVAAR